MIRDTFLSAAHVVGGPNARKVVAGLVLSVAGAGAIMTYEGVVPVVYRDAVGVPTVCAGHTATVSAADLGRDFSARCQELFLADTRDAQDAVQALVTTTVTQAQYDSLVSLTFNVGRGNLARSTLLRKLNAGDCWGAGAEFSRWVYAKGRKLAGLVKRRALERENFETGCPA